MDRTLKLQPALQINRETFLKEVPVTNSCDEKVSGRYTTLSRNRKKIRKKSLNDLDNSEKKSV